MQPDAPRAPAQGRPLVPFAAAALFACGFVGAGIASGTMPGVRAALSHPFAALAERAGLGVQQVSLSGLRFTSDKAVFEALDLPSARTLLGFDSRAAQARIEALPWVAQAHVMRVFPDGLDVRIVERQPFAVWRIGTRHYVIDRQGRRLALVAPDAMPGLRRVAGEGADMRAAGLFGHLAKHPALIERVRLAQLHGHRRWTLFLMHGATLHLPPDGEVEALDRAAALLSAGLAEKGEIDLRSAPPGDAQARMKRTPGRS